MFGTNYTKIERAKRNALRIYLNYQLRTLQRKLVNLLQSTLQVPYLSFKEAITRAKAENKLVHHILLWGALDDQSC